MSDNDIRPYGTLPDGTAVSAYVLSRDGAPRVELLDLGATLNSVRLDPDDPATEMTVAFTDVQQRTPAKYFGAVVGRVANRVANGQLEVDGQQHQLTTNEGPTTLHGGTEGFDARVWSVVERRDDAITFELTSPDGDQGFPGTLTARATYTLLDDGLSLELSATTDKTTACLLTSHAYWNLAGGGSIDDHLFTIDADQYVPIDAASIPLGELADVAGTPFDLREPARIGDRVRADDEQIGRARGIDHSYEVRGSGLRRAVRVEDPASGHWLEVVTDQPGVQVYTGNFLDGSFADASGRRLRQGDAFALEPQQHPDSPHQPWTPDVTLRPGETFHSRIEWHLGRR